MDMNERKKMQEEIEAHRMGPFDHNAESLVNEATKMAFQALVMTSYTRDEVQAMLTSVYGDAMEQAAHQAIYRAE
jgi:hypothetical protein